MIAAQRVIVGLHGNEGEAPAQGVVDPGDGFGMRGAMDLLASALRQSNPSLQVAILANRGLVLAEAMACERIVVATPTAGALTARTTTSPFSMLTASARA